jgi:hypothetical protein
VLRPFAQVDADGMRRFLEHSLPPLFAWFAALTSLWVIALASGNDPWVSSTWVRWDSHHYLTIADNGYEIHRCARGWCGNTAWFPGYPWAIAALHALRLPLAGSAVAVSWAFAAAALVLLWHSFLRDLATFAAVVGLVYAAWAPGQVFDYAVFPLSMLFFFTVLFMHFLAADRWALAGLAGAGAVLVYPIGIALAVVAAIWLLRVRSRDRLREAGWILPMPLALLTVFAVMRAQTGRWSAFFDVQRTYDHGLRDPLGVVWNAWLLAQRTPVVTQDYVGAWQTLLVSAVLVAVLLHAVWRRRAASRGDALFLLWACIAWALPLTQDHVSTWRSQAALAPLAVLVARLPAAVGVAAAGAAIVVSVPMAHLFFTGRLI